MTEEKISALRRELELRLELTESEIEEFIKRVVLKSREGKLKELNRKYPNSRIWKKEDIERLGIEVKPVRWKKLR